MVALVSSREAFGSESVHAELVRLQREYGLTFAWVDQGAYVEPSVDQAVKAVIFDTHSVIRLNDSVRSFQPNEFNLGQHPEVTGIGMCWSHRQTKLASTMVNRSTGRVTLGIIDLRLNKQQAIAINADQRPYVTSQCWSPDDKKLVYELDGGVRLYDSETDRAEDITKGTDPSWSPDGQWIGFRDGDVYYAMHPDGSARRDLFRVRWGKAVSALYWSPDSRIVAYVRELGFLQGGALDAEVNELRVRRLSDGSEDRLCPDNVAWYENYRWITSTEVANSTQAQSQ